MRYQPLSASESDLRPRRTLQSVWRQYLVLLVVSSLTLLLGFIMGRKSLLEVRDGLLCVFHNQHAMPRLIITPSTIWKDARSMAPQPHLFNEAHAQIRSRLVIANTW